MEIPIHRDFNLRALREIAPKIKNMECFAWFGTLLGYQREKNLLEFDDDIDFYMNIQHKAELIELLRESGFSFGDWRDILRPCGIQQSIVQGRLNLAGLQTYVDFYLYEKNDDLDYIVERWHYFGMLDSSGNPRPPLHVPKNILFPIRSGNIGEIEINIPNDPDACCRYLYGDEYHIPLRKNVDYSVSVVGNKPVFQRLGINPEEPGASEDL